MPQIGFAARKAGAMDARLLSRAHADRLPVRRKTHGIGLRIFEGDEGDDQIDRLFFGKVFILRHDIGKQRTIDLEFVSPLFERHAEYLFALDGIGPVIFVDFHDIVGAFALGF